jgi:hypothetical protein
MEPDIEQQLRTVFNDHGMEPSEISYNENTDVYNVSIGVEGTDARYLRSTSEIGADGPTDRQIDIRKVRAMQEQIDGTSILDGTLRVVGIESEYIQIAIDD